MTFKTQESGRIKPQMKTHIKYITFILTFLLLTTLLPLLMFHFFPSTVQVPRITIRQGTLIGLTRSSPSLPKSIDQFLGISYGESTAGNNRFRPPVRVKDGNGIFNATTYGLRCPAGAGPAYGEDCLRINVFRPYSLKNKNEKKVPVVVYVHGGSFNSGYGDTRDMAAFIANSAVDIVGVSFNYRTGSFGFLPGTAAQREGSLNVGLKDMVLALEWVNENIGAFGGDEGQVTVMGSSAGAHGIGHLLMYLQRLEAEGGKELFQRAIMESGAPTARAVYPVDHALHREQLDVFLAKLGLQGSTDADMIEKLRGLSVEDVKRASDATFDQYNPSLRWPFQPVIEGSGGFIEQAPIQAWKDGKWKKVPILTGYNTNEGAAFAPFQISTPSQFTSFFRTLLPGLNESDLTELDNAYPDPESSSDKTFLETRRGLGKQFKRTEQAYGQFAYVAPVKQTAYYTSLNTGPDSPTYLYHFAVNSSVKGGADHGTQSPFVINDAAVTKISNTLADIAGIMNAYWTSFVATGDPNVVREGKYKDRPEWKRFKGDLGEQIAVFGAGNDEIAGGSSKGNVVTVGKDDFAVEGSAFWLARTERFES